MTSIHRIGTSGKIIATLAAIVTVGQNRNYRRIPRLSR